MTIDEALFVMISRRNGLVSAHFLDDSSHSEMPDRILSGVCQDDIACRYAGCPAIDIDSDYLAFVNPKLFVGYAGEGNKGKALQLVFQAGKQNCTRVVQTFNCSGVTAEQWNAFQKIADAYKAYLNDRHHPDYGYDAWNNYCATVKPLFVDLVKGKTRRPVDSGCMANLSRAVNAPQIT